MIRDEILNRLHSILIKSSSRRRQLELLPQLNIKNFLKIYSRQNGDSCPREGNWHNVDKKHNDFGYGWIHYSLIRVLKPERILVIGSRYGYIPAICALACRDNQKGRVDFVEAGFDYRQPGNQAQAWGGVGFWKKKNVKKHFAKFGLDKYLIFYLMTSEEFYQKHSKRSWAHIHIDGDHSYKGVKADFERFWPRLEKGGFVALHDIYIKKQGGLTYGVRRLWQELKAQKRYNMIEFPGDCGLGMIQK